MNKLSQLVYLADVFDALDPIMIWLGIVLGITAVITFLVACACKSCEEETVRKDLEKHREFELKKFRSATNSQPAPAPEVFIPVKDVLADKLALSWKVMVFFSVLFFTTYVATPSKNTMYAIAASEIGEDVIKSQTASKAFRAFDAWLDKQLAKATK